MKVFLQAIFGQIVCNAYIFCHGYQALPSKRALRVPFILLFVFELLLYFFGYFFHNVLPDSTLYPVLLICNTWYIASMYLTMGLVVLDLIRLSNRIRPWYPEIIQKNWSTVKSALFFVFVFSVTGLMIKAYYNAVYPVVKHVYIHIPKVVEGKDSLTIVMMSDIHIGESIGKKHVQRFVELCNAEHPDLILIGGDVMDYELRRAEKEYIADDFQRFNAPLGVYMILGNHEYRANRYAKIRWFEKTGGILLVDSVAMPDSTFYLIGRDDILNSKRASLETLMQGVDTSKPVIVLEHRPTFARDVIDNKCDLGLYGHTHNCQYWPFSFFLKYIFEFPYGYFSEGNAHINVTSGIGFTGPPFRIGTRSELVVLHLRFS